MKIIKYNFVCKPVKYIASRGRTKRRSEKQIKLPIFSQQSDLHQFLCKHMSMMSMVNHSMVYQEHIVINYNIWLYVIKCTFKMINEKQEEICIETQNMHTICTIQYIVLKWVARENKIRSSTEVIWCPFLK